MQQLLQTLLCSICCSLSLFAQPSFNQGRALPARFCDTIPFEFISGKMVIEVEIGNKPRKFILDTGAPCAVFNHVQEELNGPIIYRDSIKDAAGGIVAMDRIAIKSFKLGQVEFKNIPALVMSEDMGKMFKCLAADGLIGSNALRHCIVQINVRDKYLILTNSPKKLDLSNSTKVPLQLDNYQSHPFIELTLNKDQVVLANFDTGDPEPFTISREDCAIPLEHQAAQLLDVGYGRMLMSLTESQSEQWFKLFKFDTLAMGTTHFVNFTSVPTGEQDYSYVGIGLGGYGILTVDYLNKHFYFQAYNKTQHVEAEAYQIGQGFTIYPAVDHYVIGMVWSNSPAARLGLKSGLKIQRIAGIDFSKRTPTLDCELVMWKYSQAKILQLEYLDEEGKVVMLSIAEE